MATSFNSSIFSSTYKDDYNDSDAYYRILFNAGRALQARELTQSQTIINKEIERFGKNIFKEGACVSGSTIKINNKYDYIKLNTDVDAGGLALPSSTTSLIDAIYTGATSGIKFRILEYYTAAQTGDVDTIYVKYIGGDTNGIYIKAADNETLENASVGDIKSISSTATGFGTRISFGEGAFFVQGHFVYSSAQSLILSYYSNSFSGDVGFKVVQDIVTATDNNALYDNQGATPNTSAPGADRYRIRLTLIDKGNVLSTEDYIHYCTVRNSKIVSQVNATDNYNKINDLIAKRTYEESGNYITKPFIAKYETNDSSSNYLDLLVSPGVAYVYGYRAAIKEQRKIPIAKPQTYTTENNVNIPSIYGNYLLVNDSSVAALNLGVPNILTLASVNILDNSKSVVGTTRIRTLEEDASSSDYRTYIFDTKMNSGKNFELDAKHLQVGDSARDRLTISLETIGSVSKAILKETKNNNVFFTLPKSRPKELSDLTMAEQRRTTGTANGSGQATITVSSPSALTNTSAWIATSAGLLVAPTIVSSSATSVTIGGLTANAAYTLLYYVSNTITPRTKTLTTTTKTSTASVDYVDSDGISYLDLGQADLYDVLVIQNKADSAGGDGVDISNSFIVDNGQRDNYYQNSRLILKSGLSKPSKTYCQFRYFSHGSGDFYSVNSYDGLNYTNIPFYYSDNLGKVDLRNVLDFRPTKQGIVKSSSFTDVNPLPKADATIVADVTTYLPRKDTLVIDKNGTLMNIQGEPDFVPKKPTVPPDALPLYNIALNANTLAESDLSISAIEAKRYTMADISRMDKRLDRLEELTTLSLLELDTKNLSVLDSSGNVRTKAGFIVDNFSTQSFSQTRDANGRINPDYKASIDIRNKILRPQFDQNVVKLFFNSDSSANVTRTGDLVTLSYSDAEWKSNGICSGTENVNPFDLVSQSGDITLSPTSDFWYEFRDKVPDKYFADGTKLDTEQSFLYNGEQYFWAGTDREEIDPTGGSTLNTSTDEEYYDFDDPVNVADRWGDGGETARGRELQRQEQDQGTSGSAASSEYITEFLGKEIVFIAFVQYMRPIKIFFKAENLRPNTRYFAFFDGKSVANWVREETYQNIGNYDVDYSNSYVNATSHPEGSSNLISDTNGVIEGSFFVQGKTHKINGASENKTFKLLDISTGSDEDATATAYAWFNVGGTIVDYYDAHIATRPAANESTGGGTGGGNDAPSVGDVGAPGAVDGTAPTSGLALYKEIAGIASFSGINKVFFGNDYLRQQPRDPLAQSFYVDNEEGIFLRKVDVYFQSKDTDTNQGVTMEIRPLVNGMPSNMILAKKYLHASQINVVGTQTVAGVLATPTTFTFDEPLYLLPQQWYAVTLAANTSKYNVYVGEVGQFVLGSTSKRITTQLSDGSLFKSSNGITWEPDQTKDLMMKLYRCSFTKTTGDVRLYNSTTFEDSDYPYQLVNNPLHTTSGSTEVFVNLPNHGMDSGDVFTLSNLTPGTRYGGLLGSSLMTGKTVNRWDETGFTFTADSSASATTYTGGTGSSVPKITGRNIHFNAATINLSHLSPTSTVSVSTRAKFTSGRSLVNREVRMNKDANWKVIRPGVKNIFGEMKMIGNKKHREDLAVSGDSASGLGGFHSVDVSFKMSTPTNYVSPILDLQRCHILTTTDRISDTSSNGHPGSIYGVAETTAIGGSAAAKHITKVLRLAQASVGFKTFIAVNRPSGSSIDLYYRTGGEDTRLNQTDWTLLSPLSTPAPDDNPKIFREYEYLAGGQNGVLTPFTQVQFKIVMRSTNQARPPKIRDFRTIAMID